MSRRWVACPACDTRWAVKDGEPAGECLCGQTGVEGPYANTFSPNLTYGWANWRAEQEAAS